MPSARTRVRKACDRCRLKKGKCDGQFPCNRCKGDDSVCAYSRRRIDRNRVYTRSYVELLERQRWQLVAGIHEMYKRLQQADALPIAAPPDASGTLDIHSVLRSLGVVNEDYDEEMDYEETSDDVVDSQHDQVISSSRPSCEDDPGHALDSERELSPASNFSYPISEDAQVSPPERTLMPELVYDAPTKFNGKNPVASQSPSLQTMPGIWKSGSTHDGSAPAVMPTSVWRARAAEYAANAGRPFRGQLPAYSTTTSCSSQDTMSPLEPPGYFWPPPLIPDAYGMMPVPNAIRPSIVRQDSGMAPQAGLDAGLPTMQWNNTLDDTSSLPTFGNGTDSLYFPRWDSLESAC